MESFKQRKLLCIGGSTKCGTTTLFDLLNQLDEIDGAVRKETRYFMSEGYPLNRSYFYEEGSKDYSNFFKGKNTSSVLLDGTPDYMYNEEALLRIRKEFESSYFVIVVRNPIDRFLSWFNFAKQIGQLNKDTLLEEFIEAQLPVVDISKPQIKNVLAQGRYSDFISRVEDIFNNDVLVISFDELKSNPKSVIAKIGDLIGESLDVEKINYRVSNKTVNIKNQTVHNAYLKVRLFFNSRTAFFPAVHRVGRKIRLLIDKIMFSLNADEKKLERLDEKTLGYLNEYYRYDPTACAYHKHGYFL